MHIDALSHVACWPPRYHSPVTLLAGSLSKEPLWQDSLAEWSKAVDSSSIIFGCVGSNPTAVTFFVLACAKANVKKAHPDLTQGSADLQSAALATELCARGIH